MTRSPSFDEQGNPTSDSDNQSDAGSVASEVHYGGKIKHLLLQADDAEVRRLLVCLASISLSIDSIIMGDDGQ